MSATGIRLADYRQRMRVCSELSAPQVNDFTKLTPLMVLTRIAAKDGPAAA